MYTLLQLHFKKKSSAVNTTRQVGCACEMVGFKPRTPLQTWLYCPMYKFNAYNRLKQTTIFKARQGSSSVFIQADHISQCQLFMNLTFYWRNLTTCFAIQKYGKFWRTSICQTQRPTSGNTYPNSELIKTFPPRKWEQCSLCLSQQTPLSTGL